MHFNTFNIFNLCKQYWHHVSTWCPVLNLRQLRSSGLKNLLLVFCLQYSEKEDKYEDEIKVLTDKLKEVSEFNLNQLFILIVFLSDACHSGHSLTFHICSLCIFPRRLRLVLSLQKGRWPNWKRPSTTSRVSCDSVLRNSSWSRH